MPRAADPASFAGPQEAAADLAWSAILAGDEPALDSALDQMGLAPKAASPRLADRCRSIGEHLARGGRLPGIHAMAGRGWAPLLAPHGASDPMLDALLSMGASGLPAFDRLLACGAKAFGSTGAHPGPPGRLLRNAVERQDSAALSRLRAQLATEGVHPKRVGAELTALANLAFDSRRGVELVSPWIKEEPWMWARACDGNDASPAKRAIHAGHLDLARTMLHVDKEAALSMIDPSLIPLSRDPLRCIDLLAEHGADFSQTGQNGLTALHRAVLQTPCAWEMCSKLMDLGADPRARDPRGATPIGLAALHWGWDKARLAFDAKPADLWESAHSNLFDSGAHAAALHILRHSAHGAGEAWTERDRASHATRAIAILRAAWEDPRGRVPEIFGVGVDLASSRGLPECLGALLELGAEHGLLPQPKDLAGSLRRSHGQPIRNAGRRKCFEIALEMGLDPAQPIPAEPCEDVQQYQSLMAIAVENLVACLMEYPSQRDEFKSMLDLCLDLADRGCDPAGVADPAGAWSFSPRGAGRSSLPAEIQAAFSEIDSRMEARALRAAAPIAGAGDGRAMRI